MGDKENGVDQDLFDTMNELFQSESVGRVLISDYTTKMDFAIPDLNKILGPDKYQVVNQDIANGLMNIFFNEEKYADSMVKIKVFLERLKEARKKYLNDFLIPEMEAIAEELGFRDIPMPEFEDIDLKDEVEYKKLYNRLAELGFLTPEETYEAYQTHKLPKSYDSIVSQEKFKELKDEGLYTPPLKTEKSDEAGRPTGTSAPQKTKTVTPVGASQEIKVTALQEVITASDKLIDEVAARYKKYKGIKRISKNHKGLIRNITWRIVQNEKMDNWSESIDKYVENPLEEGEVFEDVLETAANHNIDFLGAALLFHASKKK